MEYLQNKNRYPMKKFLLSIIIVLCGNFLFGQTISIDDYNQDAGTTLTVSVGMDNLSNLGAITLFIGYDSLVLQFDTVLNINSQFAGLLSNNMSSLHQIGIVWNAVSSGVSIVSGDLCQIRFQYVGDECDISFNAGCEAADFNADVISAVFDDGSISESFIVELSGLNLSYCLADPAVVLTGSPTGGVFEIDGISTTTFTPSVSGVGSHTISYLYENTYGFGDTVSTTVEVFANPTITIQPSDTICFNTTAEAIVTVVSGQVPFSYLWSDGQTTDTAFALTADNYTITVTDNNGCAITGSTEIIASDEIIYDFDITHLSSLGAGDGEIDLSVTAGNSPFSFSWATGSTLEDLTGLQAGVYPLTITDNLGCTQLDSVVVKAMSHQQVVIPNQWSIFSLNVEPYSPSIDIVVADIALNVVLIKDENGEVYWPFFQLNEIGDVDIGDAYQIKLNNQDTVDVDGFYIFPENTPINIPAGWSLIAYLRTSPVLIVPVFSSFVSDVYIIKNGAGQIYWPQFNLDMIINMQPGEGYQIKMATQHNLTYPAN